MRLAGPWSARQIDDFLTAAIIPVRLGAVAADGAPLVVSLWFVPLDGAIWCATPHSAHVAGLLRRQPRCAFEIAGDHAPYKGVRGQAIASLHEARGPEILQRLLTRYAIAPSSKLNQMLTKRAANETAICLEPQRLTSWDFTERMTG
jgi:nitroimidazol reductase NimA-like FMN-containing flavoprotein (pyridoxamine 5'-phosphate oxidase superfamily)